MQPLIVATPWHTLRNTISSGCHQAQHQIIRTSPGAIPYRQGLIWRTAISSGRIRSRVPPLATSQADLGHNIQSSFKYYSIKFCNSSAISNLNTGVTLKASPGAGHPLTIAPPGMVTSWILMAYGWALYWRVAGDEPNNLQKTKLEYAHRLWRNQPSSGIPPGYYLHTGQQLPEFWWRRDVPYTVV